MNEQFLILHSEHKRNSLFKIHCLGEKTGRFWCSAISSPSMPLPSLSLIEGEYCPLSPGRNCIQNPYLLDSFAVQKEHPKARKSLILIRSILEKNLPLYASSIEAFSLAHNLIQNAHEFSDWKIPPALMALHFFEQEGTSLSEFSLQNETTQQFFSALQKSSTETVFQLNLEETLFHNILQSIAVTIEYNS